MSSGAAIKTEDFSLVPTTPEAPQPQSFWERVGDAASLQWWVQGQERLSELMVPSQEGFDPLTSPLIKGKEHYAPWLREARSEQELMAMVNRYDRNEGANQRQAANGGFWDGFVASALDPINAVPIPGAWSAGLLKGAATGAVTNALAAGVAEIARASVDPTRELALKEEMLYSAAFGGLLGGALGGLSGGLGRFSDFHRGIGQLAEETRLKQADIDSILNPEVGPDGELRPRQVMQVYEARPSDGNEGFTPALGLEHVISKGGILNPLATSVGWAVQSGHRALQDLALMLGGDFSAKLKDNEVGRATPRSAYLESGRWRGMAVDGINELYRVWGEYIGRPSQLQVAGVNVSLEAQRVASKIRKFRGKPRDDGKMEFNEFLQAVTWAHRGDRIEANLERMTDKSPEAAAAVAKGAAAARPFFDAADREGKASGFLPSAGGYGRWLEGRFRMYDANEAEIARLAGLPQRTRGEEAKLTYLTTTVRPHLEGKIPVKAMKQREWDGLRVKWREAITSPEWQEINARISAAVAEMDRLREEGTGADRRAFYEAEMGPAFAARDAYREAVLDPIHGAMRALELEHGVGLRKPGAPVKGVVSNPDTSAVPPPAANEPPRAANDAAPEVVAQAEEQAAREIDAAFKSYGTDAPVPGKAANDAPGEYKFKLEEAGGAKPLNGARRESAEGADLEAMAAIEADAQRVERESYQRGGDNFRDAGQITATELANAIDPDFHLTMDEVWQMLDELRQREPADPERIRMEDLVNADRFEAAMAQRRYEATQYEQDELAGELDLYGDPVHRFTITGPDGQQAVMNVALKDDGKEIHVHWVGTDGAIFGDFSENANQFGPRFTLDVGRQLKERFPTAERVSGYRVSGARRETGSGPADTVVKIPTPKAATITSWDAHARGGFARLQAANDTMPGGETLGPDGLPPVPEGHLRLYRGIGNNLGEAKPGEVVFFTTDPAKAAQYGEVHYVDVPPSKFNSLGQGHGGPDEWITDNADIIGSVKRIERTPTTGVVDDVPPVARDENGMLPEHELVADNDNIELGGPETDPHYLPRHWNKEAIRANPQLLRDAFDKWHKDQGRELLSDGQFQSILKGILEEKEGRFDDDFVASPIGGSFRRGRQLDIPNEYVPDLIETNIGTLMLDYAHRFGPGLEVHKKFGERDAMDAIHAGVAQALSERDGSIDELLAFAAEAEKHLQDVRDMTLGDMHREPLSLSRVVAENAKAYASVTMLGKVVYSQLIEVARPLMTHGFVRNFQFITENLIGNMEGFSKAGSGLRGWVGEAMDTATGMAAQRQFEIGDLTRPGSTIAMRAKDLTNPFLKFVHGPWYIMNLMGPMTDVMKNYSLIASAHMLREDMARLVAGRAGKRTADNLAALGIDAQTARAMLAEPFEQTGKLWLANLGGWSDLDLANRFAAAVRGDINRVINTPSPQTKSAISQGFVSRGDQRRNFALLTLPFQFLSWGISATQKISMSALQGRDANALGGVVGLIGAAYLTQWLKTDDRQWDKTPFEERVFRAVDQSGVLALAGSLNNMIETGSMGTFGLRPMFGMDPPYGGADGADAAAVALGPFGSKVADGYKAFFDPTVDDWQRWSIARRALPTSGLFYTDALWKGAQRTAYDWTHD